MTKNGKPTNLFSHIGKGEAPNYGIEGNFQDNLSEDLEYEKENKIIEGDFQDNLSGDLEDEKESKIIEEK